MEKPYKLVVVTPAGRRRYMEIALPYILRERGFIDEYRIWINTTNQEDLDYFNQIQAQYPDFITLETCPNPNETRIGVGGWAIHNFFVNTIDENTVYIRVDDDIVWFDEDYFKKMYYFRISYPDFFFVSGNIINNSLCDHMHQRQGVYPPQPVFGYTCLDEHGWANPSTAVYKHNTFLENVTNNDISKYRFCGAWTLDKYERISINSLCWFGKDFKAFGGVVADDEEPWLSSIKPAEVQRVGCVNGQALCVHFAFYTQRPHIESTTALLSEYKKLSDVIRS